MLSMKPATRLDSLPHSDTLVLLLHYWIVVVTYEKAVVPVLH